MATIRDRLAPLIAKLTGRAPLCPWLCTLVRLSPRSIRVYPPKQQIRTLESAGGRKLLEFGGKHSFWFPAGMTVSAELWSEYLVAFWNHPINFHQYLRGGVRFASGDVVLDCGACEGFFTRAALDGGVKKVICIEPSETMAECLRLTFKNEIESGRVVVLQVALGSFAGSAGFASAEDDAFAGHFEGGGAETVDVTTLSAVAAKHGNPNFIKMDLEGGEYQALAGGLELLREYRPKLGITTYHEPWDYAIISSFLIGVGYRNLKPYGVTLRGGTCPRPVMVHAW